MCRAMKAMKVELWKVEYKVRIEALSLLGKVIGASMACLWCCDNVRCQME